MRRFPASLRLPQTVSVIALATAFAAPAYAQTEAQQDQAAQQDTAVECSTIADPAQRQRCVDTQGENALPESGAPAEGSIVVTGSRIKRANFETLQPAVVIDSAQIESRGFETLGQAINEQPAFGVPGSSPVGAAQGGSFGSGQSFVNFLGLGDQRTLTLVNGRRFVGGNTSAIFGPTSAGAQVDLNNINTKLVDRIETIAIGGAPIYGSDAIAGTVNVILKRDYEGIDVDGQYGISSRGDARNWRLRGLAGTNFADGRGNVTVSGEYNKGKGLLFRDRGILRQSLFEGDCPEGSQFNQCVFPDFRYPTLSEHGIPVISGGLFGFVLSPEQATDVDLFSGFLTANGLPTDIDGDGNPGTTSDIFVLFGGTPGMQDAILDANNNPLRFDQNGNLVPIDFGNRIGGPGSLNIFTSGGNGFDIQDLTAQLLTDTKRYNANLLTQFQITDNVRLFGEGWYSYSKAVNLKNQPVYNSAFFDDPGTPDGNIIISLDNPFLQPAARTIIENYIAINPFATPGEFELGRANIDIQSGRASSVSKLYRFVGGFDGNFGVGGRTFNWELVGNYGRSKTVGHQKALVQQNFENAIDAVDEGVFNGGAPNGNIICRPGFTNAAIQTGSDTCAPINPFGSGNISQAALDYILTDSDPSNLNQQWVFTGSVNGPLVTLPGGDLAFALGAEYRKEKTDFDPGTFFFGADDPNPLIDTSGNGVPDDDRVQFGRSIPIFPVKGQFHTKEVFGELRAPIISPSNSVTGIYNLELHGAARYVDHSTAGGDWTYTAEGRYAPIKDIAFRGNYTHAIRAPAITEVFNPSQQFFGFATDPCDIDQLENGPDPATRQINCAADVPPGFQSQSGSASFHQIINGNVDLKNERSNAWSVGAIVSPRFIPGLTISADYLDIRLRDAISLFSASQVLAACYDSPDFPNSPFCSKFTRDPDPTDPQVDFTQTQFFNSSELRYRGILGALDYRTRTPFLGANSRVGVNITYQYLRTLTTKADENSAPTTNDGSIGYPHHSAVVNLNYENGPLGLFSSIIYTSGVEINPDSAEDFRENPTYDAFTYINGGISFDVNNIAGHGIGKGITLRMVVDNIFDAKPDFPFPAGGGSITYFPGELGRYYRFGANLHF
jgi:outer membrane receptor protein involved in Fe transport